MSITANNVNKPIFTPGVICNLGESVGSQTMQHFQFSIWLKSSLEEVHFAENPTWIADD